MSKKNYEKHKIRILNKRKIKNAHLEGTQEKQNQS